MSHQSDISSLSRLGDNDDEMLTEKMLQTRPSQLLAKKTLSDTPKLIPVAHVPMIAKFIQMSVVKFSFG